MFVNHPITELNTSLTKLTSWSYFDLPSFTPNLRAICFSLSEVVIPSEICQSRFGYVTDQPHSVGVHEKTVSSTLSISNVQGNKLCHHTRNEKHELPIALATGLLKQDQQLHAKLTGAHQQCWAQHSCGCPCHMQSASKAEGRACHCSRHAGVARADTERVRQVCVAAP